MENTFWNRVVTLILATSDLITLLTLASFSPCCIKTLNNLGDEASSLLELWHYINFVLLLLVCHLGFSVTARRGGPSTPRSVGRDSATSSPGAAPSSSLFSPRHGSLYDARRLKTHVMMQGCAFLGV